jgi:peptide chain release factor 1
VPPTERNGRVHTSTVTVAIIENLDSAIAILKSDLKIEWYSGTGPGGQHRNKHQNSCRITHLPTGITATAQTRSRNNSLAEAMKTIEERVNCQFAHIENAKQSQGRKEQVGSGMRGDKIRTYRFQDDMVKDHNSGKTGTCTKILEGNFDLLW